MADSRQSEAGSDDPTERVAVARTSSPGLPEAALAEAGKGTLDPGSTRTFVARADTMLATLDTGPPPEVGPVGSLQPSSLPPGAASVQLGADGSATLGMGRTRERCAGDQLGRYVLEKKLGEGAHGQVFLAHDLGLETHLVAIKTVPFDHLTPEQVRSELETLARVGHPHVVALIDHGIEPDLAWFAMPFYKGQTLDAWLKDHGTMGLEQAHLLFEPLASALASLHASGFRHQDVKPENVFLAEFPGVKAPHPLLLDLGVATRLDQQGVVAGTREYMAPEQLAAFEWLRDPRKPQGERLSEKMDVYSLAATLLHCITGGRGGGAELFSPTFHELELRESLAVVHRAQLDRAQEPLPKGVLPELRGVGRRKLIAAFKRWLGPAAERPDADDFARELDVLLEPRRLAAAARRARTQWLIGASLVATVGTVGGVGIALLVGGFQESLEACEGRIAESARKTGSYVEDARACNAQKTAISSRLGASEASTRVLEERERRLTGELANATREETRYRQTLEGTNSKLVAMTAERDALTKERDTLSADKTKLEAERTALTAEKTKLEASLKTAEGERDDAKAKAAKAEADVAAKEKEASEARAALDGARAEAAKAKQESDACKASLATANGKLASCARAPAPTPGGSAP